METIWTLKKADKDIIDDLSCELEIPLPIARVLAVRGLDTPKKAQKFLRTDLEFLHNPFLLPDAKPVLDRLNKAIDAQEKIELKSTGTTSTQISVNLSSLPQQVMQLQGGNANTPVVISADKGIKYETVVKIMDSLQRAGVQRVGLSVQLQP
jgi:hypothetical protein